MDAQFSYKNYILNGKGFVRMHFMNSADTSSYMYLYSSQLPSDQYLKRFEIYSDSLVFMEINADKPTINYLLGVRNSESAIFMVLPNDTLDIMINNKDIRFKGQTSLISEYFSKSKRNFWNYKAEKTELPDHFNAKINSSTLLALSNLEDFNQANQLPDWFLEYEKTDIFFYAEALKNFQYSQRFMLYNQFIKNSSNVASGIKDKELEIKLITENIAQYLDLIRPPKYDTLFTPQNYTENILFQGIRDNIKDVKGRLSDTMMSYFVASKLSSTIAEKKLLQLKPEEFSRYCKKVDSLFIEMTPLIKDTLLLNFINDFKVKQYKGYLNQVKLKNGEKAPFFILEDINGKSVKLSDFKGKLILINFWGTFCAPCIQSIPEKNEIIQKYSKSDFVLLNIILDYDFKKWKEIIDKYKFDGIHLKCKGNWEKLLKEKYNILGVPHYTLIDRDGNIIANNVQSGSLESIIKSNL
jgi:peroxiredoxin